MSAEEKIEGAVEELVAAEASQAESAAAVADAVVQAKTAEAAAMTAVAAETAVALAEQSSAVANAQAADTITQAQGDIAWLRQNAEKTANFYQKQETELSQLRENQNTMAQTLGTALEALQSLTQAPLTPPNNQQTPEVVNPKKEDVAAQGDQPPPSQSQSATKAQARTGKRVWI